MRNAIALFTSAVAAVSLQAACNHDRAAETTLTGAGIVTTDDAVNQLSARRCQRETDCNNIGTGKHYDDNAACEREMNHDLEADLRPSKCTYGVREDRLAECLEEIRNEKCGNLLDMMSRLSTCRTGRLCIR
jgi:hypothetical protein